MSRLLVALSMMVLVALSARAQSGLAVVYRVTFPEPEHHWLQVEATFAGLGQAPLRARMSRSSPGRYSIHEFAKNVFSVEAFDGQGRPLRATRPDVDEWNINGHDGTVRLVYRIFGDHADGTYMGVDTTHAHLNMPATFMWAAGLEMRPIQVAFTPPVGSGWKVATQLFAASTPFAFTAPNLQYFMDSPTELSDHVVSTFRVPNGTGAPTVFRITAHSDGSQADIDELARSVERLLREQRAVFGAFPSFEPGHYTFLLDFVPWAHDDGMEHRNSTSISSSGVSLRTPQGRRQALSTISHEFFHVWNVERFRPAGIEPFDFTRANVTCCLWLAEGFTDYYEPLLLLRAGFAERPPVDSVPVVVNGSGRLVRSAVEMSEHAPFADLGLSNDMNDRDRTFISYYTYGAAIALGLDLSLREISKGTLSLDDYMRRLWQNFGTPPDPRPGYVTKPYSLADLRNELAGLTGSRRFADEFFDRFIEGREVVEYGRLLGQVGFVLRRVAPARGWIGSVDLDETGQGLVVGSPASGSGSLVPLGTPLYDAGIDEGDVIVSIDGTPATFAAWAAIAQKKPGESVALVLRRRDGRSVTTSVSVRADPQIQVVPIESTGAALTDAQRGGRQAWLGTKVQ